MIIYSSLAAFIPCSILAICSTLLIKALAFSCPSSSHCGFLVEEEGAVVEGAQCGADSADLVNKSDLYQREDSEKGPAG